MSWTVKAADGEIAYYASGHVEIPFHKKLIVARNDAEADQKLDEWAKTFAPNARAMPSEFATGQELEQGVQHVPSSIQAQEGDVDPEQEHIDSAGQEALEHINNANQMISPQEGDYNEMLIRNLIRALNTSIIGVGSSYVRRSSVSTIMHIMNDLRNNIEGGKDKYSDAGAILAEVDKARSLMKDIKDIIDPPKKMPISSKQSWVIKAQENMVKMTGFLLDQKSYLVAADPAVPGAYHTSYYPSEWFESDWAIVEFEIPENEVAKVSTMGTMEQEFSDGYEGWDYVEKLIGNKFSVIEEGEGTSEEFQGEEIPEGAVVKTPEQL